MYYQKTGTCELCQRQCLLLWHPTGPFQGQWLCGRCHPAEKERFGDGLADLAKAVQLKEPPA